MSTEKLNIVPVKVEAESTPTSNDRRSPLSPVCVIQTKKYKISIFPDARNYVIQTIMKELVRDDA